MKSARTVVAKINWAYDENKLQEWEAVIEADRAAIRADERAKAAEAYQIQKTAIEQLEQRQWISVKERLPKHQEDCDIWHPEYGRIADCTYMDYSDGTQHHFYCEDKDLILSVQMVTHWMPLPEPPLALIESEEVEKP